MPQKILVALSAGFFAAEKNKQHRAFWPLSCRQRPRQFENRHATGSVVIGAVINTVALYWRAHAQVIKMSRQQDDLLLQLGIAAPKHSDHIARMPRLSSAAKIECAGDVLNKVARVPLRRNSNLPQCARQIPCRPEFVRRATTAPAHGITGKSAQLVSNLSGRCLLG